VALLALDEDGDGRVRLPDAPELRLALLKPVIGLVEDVRDVPMRIDRETRYVQPAYRPHPDRAAGRPQPPR
jgi:hypothetical protein